MVYRSRIINYEFHFNAFPETFRNARFLRKNMSPTEKMLWRELRNKHLAGYKFRRQHPVGQFIVDFYCVEARLIIEIDGSIHDKAEVYERDSNRTAELERLGLKVIRFTNEEVINDIESVLHTIDLALKHSTSSPPLQIGEGAGG